MKLRSICWAGLILLTALAMGCSRAAAPRQAGTLQGGAYQIQDPNLTPPGTLPIVRQEIPLSLGIEISIWVTDYYDNDFTRYLQDMTGVKLEFVFYDPGADGQTRLNLQVASGEALPDIIFNLGVTDAARREAYGRAGAIIPLNDYIEHIGTFTAHATSQVAQHLNGLDPWYYGTDDDGNIWGYMAYIPVFPNQNSGRAWYNREFADALGMHRSEWTGGDTRRGFIPTQDWFVRYLRGVRDNDVNGNGVMNDEIPLMGNTGWRGNLLNWLTRQYIYSDYSSTNNYWFIDDRGQLDVVYDKPLFQEALGFINMLYNERLWDEVSLTQSTPNALLNQDHAIVGAHVAGSISVDFPRSRIYENISVVQGPHGYASNTFAGVTPGFPFVISANAQYPEAAFRFLDATASDPEFAIIPRYGMKDVHWRVAVPGELSVYETIGPNVAPVGAYVIDLIDTWGYNQTVHWRSEFGIDYMRFRSGVAWDGNDDSDLYRHGILIQEIVPFNPTVYPVTLKYTSTELEQWGNTRVEIRNYVNQALALFGTGQMHHERDWNTFLDTLRRMGYQELLAMDQGAYARMRAIMGN